MASIHGVEKEPEKSCPAQGPIVHVFMGSAHLVRRPARDFPLPLLLLLLWSQSSFSLKTMMNLT